MCVRDASPTVNLSIFCYIEQECLAIINHCWRILETTMTIRTDIIVVFYLLILRIFAWDQLPQLPVGRRVQYYFLHTNGNYKYGYDTGNGHATEVSSNPRVTEATSHENSLTDGIIKQNQKFDSSLGSGTHQGQEETSKGGYFVYTNTVGSNKGLDVAYTLMYNDVSSGRHADQTVMAISRPHSFSYDHTEKSDNSDNVEDGHYSFTNKDDTTRTTVDYTAGIGKGFVTRGMHFPKSASSDNKKSDFNNIQTNGKGKPPLAAVAADGSYSFSFETDDHSRTEAADSNGNVKGSYSFINKDDNIRRIVNYEAGANKGFVVRQQYFPQNVQTASVFSSNNYDCNQQNYFGNLPEHCQQVTTEPTIDKSYSFGYETPDQLRKEMSDASGNIKGSYSFISKDDGVRRTIDYEAGAGKGFVARGTHLPVPRVGLQSTYTPAKNSFGTIKTINGQSSDGFTDGSYSFGYETSDGSRQESSDVNGNVKGSYSFVSNDGVRRRIDYEAGAGKGFIARGSHFPKTPVDSSLQGIYNTEIDSVESVKTSKGQSSRDFTDGSYSYGYETNNESRQESSDVRGNVKGSLTYSFVSKDGVRRRIDYEAGAGKGFVARGPHLPVAPVAGIVGTLKNTYNADTTDQTSVLGDNTKKVSNFILRTYLPPNNNNKYGYIFESSH